MPILENQNMCKNSIVIKNNPLEEEDEEEAPVEEDIMHKISIKDHIKVKWMIKRINKDFKNFKNLIKNNHKRKNYL
jgi:hypothetical protein